MVKNMKVAIITFHRAYNYGSPLQAYASQKVFEKRGHVVKIIDYITPRGTKLKVYWAKGSNYRAGIISRIIYRLAKIGSIILREQTLGRFVRSRLNLTKKYITPGDLEKDPPKADIYVTGSDQVWNSYYNQGIDRSYYLDFLPENARRISFVSSFGKTELDPDETGKVRQLLSRYEKLSVREDSAVKIITDLGLEAPVHLIDPTLMLRKEEWLEMASPRLVREPYLILMFYDHESDYAIKYARKIADEKGLKLVKLSGEMTKPPMVDQLFTHRTPSDFISLFYHADFIVTNSFHGLAFSLNLEKQFIAIPRVQFNTRIESLLRLVGLSDRFVTNEEQALNESRKTIDYGPVNERMERERIKVNEFLDSIEGI